MNEAVTIRPEHDPQGLTEALRSLFEEAYTMERLEPQLARMDDEECQRTLAELQHDISPGYIKAGVYLLSLAHTLTLGVPLDPATFTQADLNGLACVRVAKAQFETDHPPCPHCGQRLQQRQMSFCPDCQTAIKRRRS